MFGAARTSGGRQTLICKIGLDRPSYDAAMSSRTGRGYELADWFSVLESGSVQSTRSELFASESTKHVSVWEKTSSPSRG